MLKTEEVLIMLIDLFQKVAKTGEMLIMLIIWGFTDPPILLGGGPHKSPND